MPLPVKILLLPALFGLSYWIGGAFWGKNAVTEVPQSIPTTTYQLGWSEQLAEDPAKATKRLSGDQLTYSRLEEGVRRWATQDAHAAWEFVKLLPQKAWRQKLAKLLLESAVCSRSMAEELWAAIPPSWQTSFLGEKLAGAFLRGGEDDFAAALALANKMPPSPTQAGFLKALLGHWADTAPTAAANFLANLEMNAHLRDVQIQLAVLWAKRDAQAAMAWLEGLDTAGQDIGKAGILARIAEHDLGAALALFAQATRPSGPAAAALAGKLFEKQGPSALAWVDAITAKLGLKAGAAVVQAFFAAWAKSDPSGASATALREPDEALRLAKLAAATQTWSLTPGQGQAALEFAKTLPPDQAANLYRAMLSGSGSGKTEELASLLSARVTAYENLQSLNLPADPSVTLEAASLAAKWAETQPVQALDWALGLPTASRETALNSSLHLGMEAHFEQTRTWYEKQSPATRALGLIGAARGASRFHPDTALQWLEGSTEPKSVELKQEILNRSK